MTKIAMMLAVLLAIFAFGCTEQGSSVPADENGETSENGEAVETSENSGSDEVNIDFEFTAPEVGQWIAYSVEGTEGEFKLSIVAEEDYDGTACLWYQIEMDGEALAQVLVDPAVVEELIALSGVYMEEFVADPAAYIRENMPEDGNMLGNEDTMENMMLSLTAIKQVKVLDGEQLMLLDMAGVPALVEQMIADNPEMLEETMQIDADDTEMEEFLAELEDAEFSMEEIEVDGLNCIEYTITHPEEGSMVAIISMELPISPIMEATIIPTDPAEEGGMIYVTGFGFEGAENLITGEPDQVIPLAMMLQGFASQMQPPSEI